MDELWAVIGLFAFVAGASAFFGAILGVASCLVWLLYEDAKMERYNQKVRLTMKEPADAYRSRQYANYNQWGK